VRDFSRAPEADLPRFLISNAANKFQVYDLRAGEHLIGREGDVQLLLPNVSVSRQHAKVSVSAAGCILEDLSSGNGTTVNGATVLQHTLVAKDEVKIGKFSLVFLDDSRAEEFYKGRCVRYMPAWEPRGEKVRDEATFMLSKEALKAMATQSRLLESARILLVRDPSRFWFPEGRPLTFGSGQAHVGVNGWFVPATAAEVTWDGSRHLLHRKAWWVPVRVNDVPVGGSQALRHNDRLTIGESRFRYEGEK
jgi:predicted component of type VI protein secretion system